MKRPRGVPRDEWLLAIGLANQGARRHANYAKHGFIHHVAAWVKDAPLVIVGVEWARGSDSDELAAMVGAFDTQSRRPEWSLKYPNNPDAYAAGAAIAMALEEDS